MSPSQSAPNLLRADAPSQGITSPKRTVVERRGVHAWHNYYAGFSEGFVGDVLTEFGVRPGAIVLDPMNGSGTTTMVAQQRGFLALGNEMNPAMATIARAKDAVFHRQNALKILAEQVVENACGRTDSVSLHDDAAAWIPPGVFNELKRIEAEIDTIEGNALAPLHAQLSSLAVEGQPGGTAADLFRAALLLTARKVSTAEDSKNPTWIKPGDRLFSFQNSVYDVFEAAVGDMLTDLDATFREPSPTRRLLITDGDARRLSFRARIADIIITSPPYLTRIDYAVGTSPELVVLGYETEAELRTLRKEIMGSTCVAGGKYATSKSWGRKCLDTVSQVRRHPSKASDGYYYKMHVQYFRDAEAIIRESLRALKPGCPAIFVVQDSWYKDVHVPLGDIYVEMALKLGAKSAKILHSEIVRNHLGLVNSRARQYEKGDISEHVVVFWKR